MCFSSVNDIVCTNCYTWWEAPAELGVASLLCPSASSGLAAPGARFDKDNLKRHCPEGLTHATQLAFKGCSNCLVTPIPRVTPSDVHETSDSQYEKDETERDGVTAKPRVTPKPSKIISVIKKLGCGLTMSQPSRDFRIVPISEETDESYEIDETDASSQKSEGITALPMMPDEVKRIARAAFLEMFLCFACLVCSLKHGCLMPRLECRNRLHSCGAYKKLVKFYYGPRGTWMKHRVLEKIWYVRTVPESKGLWWAHDDRQGAPTKEQLQEHNLYVLQNWHVYPLSRAHNSSEKRKSTGLSFAVEKNQEIMERFE